MQAAIGTVAAALRRGEALLGTNPARAVQQAQEILTAAPAHPQALLILGVARARLGDLDGARAVLQPLARAQPRAAAVQLQWGLVLAAGGDIEPAIAAMRLTLALRPTQPQAWRILGDLLILAQRHDEADAAYAQHLLASVADPALMAAAAALCAGDLAAAERMLRARLMQAPTDVAAIRMLAEVATRLGRYAEAERLLSRCLELAPGFSAARHHYAVVLYRQHRVAEAVPHMELLVAAEPQDPSYRTLLAASLAGVGHYDRSIALYRRLTEQFPKQARLWLSYGHALRTAGQRDATVAAYRACLALAPALGEAWWSLANLKAGVLGGRDVAAMLTALAAPDLTVDDRFHLQYALGHTLEQMEDYPRSFAHYAEGATLRRGEVSYNADALQAQVERSVALFRPALLAQLRDAGCDDPAPIFVVGLPRSGSTLIEQMLASHPLVEGTMELPELTTIVREIAADGIYPDCLAALPKSAFAALGARYLERAKQYRHTERPFFIDKLPNNWLHVGLIALILPGAKIIDARRHPMATCFSAFKQHFATGQNYSYDQAELGRYYCDYVALMAHMDAVLPGRVHRVLYEDMVQNTEPTLRALLAYCGLDYDPACLHFHQNARPVRTASSEQVRRPLFRDGLEQWRHYAPWLGPLRQALARVLTD